LPEPEVEKKQSFWTTMPGILTGLAALLTAATGLWVAIGPHDKPAEDEHPTAVTAPTPLQSSAPGSAPPVSTQQSPASSPAATAQAGQYTVTLTSRAGEVTKLSAKTFVHNYTDKTIELTSGQTIAFERIKVIDFFTVHPDERSIDVKVTLTDGRVVDGALKKDYAFNGESDLGPFHIFVQDVKQVVFAR
jgi:hypothetical protein